MYGGNNRSLQKKMFNLCAMSTLMAADFHVCLKNTSIVLLWFINKDT